MAIIKIPKTPASAYNPGRPANALVIAQVNELERAVRERGGRIKRARPVTEGDAASYIRQLTRGLHHQTLLPQIKAAASPVALGKPAPGKKSPRKKAGQTRSRKSRSAKATASRRKTRADGKRRRS